MSWTDDRIKMLQYLWLKGLSATQIRSKINYELDANFSRSAILGKAHRMGMLKRTTGSDMRRQTLPPTQPVKRQSWQRPRAPFVKPDPVAAPDDLMAMVDLEKHNCRWPYGDPKSSDFGFCGSKCMPNQSYCPQHMVESLNHVQPAQRRARPEVVKHHSPARITEQV